MSGDSYTRWHNRPSDDDDGACEEEGGGEEGGAEGGGGVTIVTSGSSSGRRHRQRLQHQEQDLPIGAKARLLCVLVLVCATCLGSGVLLGYYCAGGSSRRPHEVEEDLAYDPPLHGNLLGPLPDAELLDQLDTNMIKGYMRNLHQTPAVRLSDYLESTWKAQGLTTSTTAFTINLSKPDPDQPNTVEVTYKDGHRVVLNPLSPTLNSPPFVAFSGGGVVTGMVVYGHYGTRDDLVKLQAIKVPLKGVILLLRHGRIHDGTKVHNAEKAGAVGVLLYPDPEDFGGEGGKYPDGTGLPQDGVVWGSLNTVPGDPATPFLPSLHHIYRAPGPSKTLPTVPAHTISYESAKKVMELLGGPIVPEDWRGKTAEGAADDRGPTPPSSALFAVGGAWVDGAEVVNITLTVNNIVYQETLRNVHATLPARDETRMVMVGCHYGSLYSEPAAGMAALLALSEAMAKTFPDGTHRKLVFSAWAAGDYGMVGSTEFTQLFSSWLESSLLAYLSLDRVIEGTGSMRVSASPMLYEAIREAANRVTWPDETSETKVSVRDGWRLSDPVGKNDVHFSNLAAESDYASFAAQHGIPSAHFTCMGKDWMPTYGLSHTQYDSTESYRRLLDPDYHWTLMIASLVGVVAVVMSEARVPPVDFREVSGDLYNGWQRFLDLHSPALNKSGYDFTGVLEAVGQELEILDSSMTSMTQWYTDLLLVHTKGKDQPCGPISKDLDHRQIEARLYHLMRVGRGLLGPRGVGRTFTTHLTLGPDPLDPLQPAHYPHLGRAITLALARKTPWESVHQELSYVLASLTSFRALFPTDAIPDTFPIL